MKDKAILEAIAHVLAKQARYDNSLAAMLLCNLAEDLRNFLPDSEINELYAMYEQAKTFEQFGGHRSDPA